MMSFRYTSAVAISPVQPSGSGDGGIYAMKAQTGEKVWGYVAAKRAINTGVAQKSHDRAGGERYTRAIFPVLAIIAEVGGHKRDPART